MLQLDRRKSADVFDFFLIGTKKPEQVRSLKNDLYVSPLILI